MTYDCKATLLSMKETRSRLSRSRQHISPFHVEHFQWTMMWAASGSIANDLQKSLNSQQVSITTSPQNSQNFKTGYCELMRGGRFQTPDPCNPGHISPNSSTRQKSLHGLCLYRTLPTNKWQLGH